MYHIVPLPKLAVIEISIFSLLAKQNYIPIM
jgi:hypothetical protein